MLWVLQLTHYESWSWSSPWWSRVFVLCLSFYNPALSLLSVSALSLCSQSLLSVSALSLHSQSLLSVSAHILSDRCLLALSLSYLTNSAILSHILTHTLYSSHSSHLSLPIMSCLLIHQESITACVEVLIISLSADDMR